MPKREDVQFPPGNDVVVSKGPCSKCGSSDGRATYGDGHEHCFVCSDTSAPSTDDAGAEPVRRRASGGVGPGGGAGEGLLKPDPQFKTPAEFTNKRKLKPETLRAYGYFLAGFKGQTVQVAPYFSMDGELACQKVRTPGKEFLVLKRAKSTPDETVPSIGECQLWGRQVFGDRYDRRVVITEGELDAMSVFQELAQKCAVVSINGGTESAVKCLKANFLWLDRFEEIVLWFDADEPGQKHIAECAKLFKVGKVKVVQAQEGAKDASDLLQQGRPGDISTAIYGAVKWVPKGIRNARDLVDDVLAPTEDSTQFSYKWVYPGIQEFVGDIKPGQVVYHVAGTGIGKTAGISEIVYDLSVNQGAKVAYFGFEDTRRDVMLRFMGVHASKRLDLEPLPDASMRKLHTAVFGSGGIELFDPETAEWTVDAIMSYFRFCARALDCQVLIGDPLSFIAAGMDASTDERRALDKVSRDTAALAKELSVHIQFSHHLTRPTGGIPHEEGGPTSLAQVRGSGGIANFASIVIGHERNQQAEREEDTLITQFRCLKNRPKSRTGLMGTVEYDLKTGRLLPTSKPFPPIGTGKGKHGGSGPSGGFPPAEDY